MLDLFQTNGSSPPLPRRCGSTLGATCWLGSVVARRPCYHAPCGEPAGHLGACLCPTCGKIIAMREMWPVRMVQATNSHTRELAALTVYVVVLALVTITDFAMLPLAALTGAISLRWAVWS